jgi:hypothetical protein
METPDKRTFSSSYVLDKVGMWTSAICVIHCVVFPVLVTFSVFSGLAFANSHAVEYSIFSVSVLLGVISLCPSYFRHHRSIYPGLILLSGFLLIGLSRILANEGEHFLTASGATLIASAHYLNYRLCRIAIEAWTNNKE